MSKKRKFKEEIRLAIVGSRTFKDRRRFDAHVAQWISAHGQPSVIISGEEPNGTDAMAKAYALENNIPYVGFPPDWRKHGKAAGPRRNQQIVDDCTHVLAFPSRHGRGTQNSLEKAEVAKRHVTEIAID